MKVVVTGGAGFIGANLCRQLLANPEVTHVVALDDLSTGFLTNLDGVDAEFVQGSILDPDTLDRCMEGASSVVHLGARPSVPRSVADPVASHNANATGTMNVLEAARKANGAHVVVASSSSVYGANPTLPKHEDLATRPMSPYAASKLATESYTLAWQHSYGMPTLAFRFFNVFGPLQAAGHAYAAVVPAFVDAALKGEPLSVHGDGTQSRDFTYVRTVCSVITDAVVRKVSSPEPVNLAFGSRTNLLEVIELLEELLERSLDVTFTESRVGDVKHSQADNARLRALFPDVQPVDLREGLAATVDWFRTGAVPPAS
jgi:UDP-glucose 4-epimerase